MGVYSKSSTVNEFVIDMSNITGEGHIMDAVIESVTNDLNMFNAVITLDFAEAYTNLGMDVFMEGDEGEASDDGAEKASGNDKAKEAGKDGIFKKIGTAIGKLVEKLINTAKSFANKFADLFKTNKKLYEKYSKDFRENAKSKDIKIRKIGTAADSKVNGAFGKAQAAMNNMDKMIEDAMKSESYDNDDVEAEEFEEIDGDESSEKVRKLTSEEIEEIDHVMKEGANKPAIVVYLQNMAKLLKGHHVVLQKKNASTVAAANYEYKVTIKTANKLCTEAMKAANSYNRHFALCRKAFLLVARGQAEESKEESAVMDEVIGIASDIYMESVFAM